MNNEIKELLCWIITEAQWILDRPQLQTPARMTELVDELRKRIPYRSYSVESHAYTCPRTGEATTVKTSTQKD